MLEIITIFEDSLLKDIDEKGSYKTFSAGDVLLEPGKIVRFVPFVLKGLLKVSRIDEDGHELFLYYIKEMESCAMTFTCCMQNLPSEIKVVVEEETELVLIPISLMDEWMVKYTSWKTFVMKTIRSRFQELLKTIDQIAFQKLDDRLLNYLKTKTEHSKLLNISHQQIADDLATSRVVISRLLKKLENDGKLLLYRNQIKVLNLSQSEL